MVKSRLRLSSKRARSFDIGLRNKDKKSDPEKPTSPLEPVAYPAAKGALIGIGLAIPGATNQNHVTTDSNATQIFVIRYLSNAV
jgi:hypothetical protein